MIRRKTILFFAALAAGGILPGVSAQDNAAPAIFTIAKVPDAKKAMLCFTFDDDIKDQLTEAVPRLEKYGFRGTFSVIAATVGQGEKRLSWDDLKEMKKRGHEIGNHSMTHPRLTETAKRNDGGNAIRREINGAYDMILEEAGFAPETFCYPFNAADADVNAIVAERHLFLMNCPRANYGGNTTLKSHRQEMENLLDKGGHLVIMIHGLTPNGGGWNAFHDPEIFEQVVKEVKGQEARVHVGTFGDNLRYQFRRENSRIIPLNRDDSQAIYRLELNNQKDFLRGPLTICVEKRTAETADILVNGEPVKLLKNADGVSYFQAVPDAVLTAKARK